MGGGYENLCRNSDVSDTQIGALNYVNSFRSLSYSRSTAPSKVSSSHSAIQCVLFQLVSSRFLKII